jgi:hypothetical protein
MFKPNHNAGGYVEVKNARSIAVDPNPVGQNDPET